MKPFGRDRHRSQQVQRDNVPLPGGVGGVPPSLFPLRPSPAGEGARGLMYKYKTLPSHSDYVEDKPVRGIGAMMVNTGLTRRL